MCNKTSSAAGGSDNEFVSKNMPSGAVEHNTSHDIHLVEVCSGNRWVGTFLCIIIVQRGI